VAYDEELADRLRLLLAGRGTVEKRMFGGLAFLVNGNMAVAASGQGGLMVRVSPEQTETLRQEPGAEPFVMRDRPMRGWLRVAPEVLEDDAVLRTWVERGLAYAGTLPPK
jgi:TfoX/Sxy family transcriptional regulator of competence genes